MFHTSLASCAILGICALPSLAAETKTGFLDRVHKNADGKVSPYVVFVPHSYDGSQAVPIILFLHGAGETKGGKGKKMPKEVGLGSHIKGKREKNFPAIVVIPQAESFGWQAENDNAKRALKMLDEVMKDYKCDLDRVYLTGLSMGGFGTWSIAAAHPDRWAAIVPICGGLRFPLNKKDGPSAEDVANKIKHIPCWNWHGDADNVVKVELSREIISALKKVGGSPKYSELPKVGHNSWDAAYGTDELYEWLFAQKKSAQK